MKSAEKIAIFKETFKGRTDVVPRYWFSKKSNRSGYSPLCHNEWKKGICHKPCRTCNNADYIPLSDFLLLEHFKGHNILGIYPLLTDNTCNFIAADFDNHHGRADPFKDAREYHEVCEVQEIPNYILRSKSGAGFHSYIFFQNPVPSWKARKVALALLKEADVIGEDAELSSFDRLFPNQDELSGKGFGNLIALPFQGKVSRYGRTLILDPDKGFRRPYRNQWEILAGIKRTSEKNLDDLIQEWDLKPETAKSGAEFPLEGNSKTDRLLECDFIRWCRDEPAGVPEPLWYALISNVISLRPGGYRLCHELSRGHPKYDRRETDAKILHALDSSGPHTCEYIKANGFRCEKGCSVKAPACLFFNSKAGGK